MKCPHNQPLITLMMGVCVFVSPITLPLCDPGLALP